MAGLVNFTSNGTLDAQDAERVAQRAAQDRQATPYILSLASHVRKCWESARDAKQPIERGMLKALRQRKGEYEPEKLNQIKEAGGSEIFMMITETKCRGAESWLRDILLDEGMVPFAIKPTPDPEMPPDFVQTVTAAIAQKVIGIIQSGMPIDQMVIKQMEEQAKDDARQNVIKDATDRAERHQRFITDQFVEGGMVDAFDAFLSDLTTYPLAILKGPTVRRVRTLDWTKQPDGSFAPEVTEKLAPTYSRVDPFRFYVEPGITRLQDGYTIEHHKLSDADLSDLIGIPGYDEAAVRAVLDEGSNSEWLWSAEYVKSDLENKYNIWRSDSNKYDALEFWGRVSGKMLREWGLDDTEVPDTAKMYDANVWLVGRWVIKATLNYDPLGDKPYRCTSFVKRPGSFWGSGIPELIEDVQGMCNASARALANNMGIASGPQVEVTTDRLPQGAKVSSMYPWKIWQTLSDPMGSGQPAIRFNQPDDRSGPLMTVYQNFARMADEQSGVPAYVYGDGQVGGAGRTASGLSMLMGSAGKGIRQVVMHTDFEVIGPTVTAQYNWNMQYVDREDIKGDCEIIPRGAVTLANRDQLNVRRVEFLQATANPIDAEIVGIPGRAAILREVAKGLAMPVDDIVPSDEQLDIQAEVKRQQEAMAAQAGQAPQEVVVRQGESQSNPTAPDGNRMGGKESNVVSNRQTGGGGA
tara:strand:- start:2092 stop:4176 length:2085 start_codon:yes stop_codon:yes gene_type:complete